MTVDETKICILAEDYKMVLSKAKTMGYKKIKALYNIPIQNMELIVQALEKQTAKRPDYEGDGYGYDGELIYDTWICPGCEKHYEVDYDNYDYCPNCGQHIDRINEE